MNPQTALDSYRRKLTLQLVLFASLAALCGIGLVSSSAQSNKEEREFKNTIPNHVPVKLKLKNEQSLKKLDNKNWARELEVEIKNTGAKPIYFINIVILMEDLNDDGFPLSFQITYGRTDLVRLSASLLPDDVPILPGETVTLKIPEKWVKGYEDYRNELNRPDPKKVSLDLQIISFGDGTGLHGLRGDPLTSKTTKG